jgi:hypothetical protein
MHTEFWPSKAHAHASGIATSAHMDIGSEEQGAAHAATNGILLCSLSLDLEGKCSPTSGIWPGVNLEEDKAGLDSPRPIKIGILSPARIRGTRFCSELQTSKLTSTDLSLAPLPAQACGTPTTRGQTQYAYKQ